MLILTKHYDTVRYGHIDLVVVVPRVYLAITVRQQVLIVVVVPGRPDALRHSHLFADVVRKGGVLKHRIVVVVRVASGTYRAGHFVSASV